MEANEIRLGDHPHQPVAFNDRKMTDTAFQHQMQDVGAQSLARKPNRIRRHDGRNRGRIRVQALGKHAPSQVAGRKDTEKARAIDDTETGDVPFAHQGGGRTDRIGWGTNDRRSRHEFADLLDRHIATPGIGKAPAGEEAGKDRLLLHQPMELILRQHEQSAVGARNCRGRRKTVGQQAAFAEGVSSGKLGDHRAGGIEDLYGTIHDEIDARQYVAAVIDFGSCGKGKGCEPGGNPLDLVSRKTVIRMDGLKKHQHVGLCL